MNRFTTTESTWSGTPVVRLEDHQTETVAVVAPLLGANLISLTVKGRQLLRTPPDAEAVQVKPARWGIPVLMPPNRIAGGRFTFRGREYQLEINNPAGHHSHGFVLRRPWAVADSAATEGEARVTLVFDAALHPDVLAQFPHPFVLKLTYTLQEHLLRCDSEISNPGKDAMPFGLGFHHYLLAPDDGSDRYAIRIVPPTQQWELVDLLPTGRFVKPEGAFDLANWQPLHAVRRDGGYALDPEQPDGSRFELSDRSTGQTVTLEADAHFRHWVIFNGNPGFEGFVCPEPYTCMTNAFNLDLPPAVSGMVAVEAGEQRPAGTWMLTWS